MGATPRTPCESRLQSSKKGGPSPLPLFFFPTSMSPYEPPSDSASSHRGSLRPMGVCVYTICVHMAASGEEKRGGPFFELWGRGSQGVFGVALNEIPPSGSVGGAILFELEQKQISILRGGVSVCRCVVLGVRKNRQIGVASAVGKISR